MEQFVTFVASASNYYHTRQAMILGPMATTIPLISRIL